MSFIRHANTYIFLLTDGYFIGGCDDLRAKPKDEVRGLINGPHV